MEEEAQIKRSMVAAAREVFAVVDHTKWERIASATFCRTERLTGVFTDDEAPPSMVAALREAGIDVREVGPADAEAGRPGAAVTRANGDRGPASLVPGVRAVS
jgi:hypothetical protein